MPDGGWVTTHEDITELKATRAVANERLSLQALIDCLPDSLWVKDVDSRFVIANKTTANHIGVAGPADLIGKSDLELLPMEFAQKFFADEQRVVQSGQPMLSQEEYAWGNKTWVSTTKVPLRNDRGEIFAVAGMSRDITERKLAEALARRAGANPRDDRDERAAGRCARSPHAPRRIPADRDIRLRPAARRRRDPLAPRRRAESAGGLYQGRRRPAHRSQSGVMRHGRLSAGSRHRRRYHDRPAVGRLQGYGRGSGRRAWASFMLVDPDPVASRRGRSAHSRCIRRLCANRPRPRRASSTSPPASPASRSSASSPKTAFVSWPTMTR